MMSHKIHHLAFATEDEARSRASTYLDLKDQCPSTEVHVSGPTLIDPRTLHRDPESFYGPGEIPGPYYYLRVEIFR